MIWINFEGRRPTDTDVPEGTRWSVDKWQKWLDKSQELCAEVEFLQSEFEAETVLTVKQQKLKERNECIEANSDHWGELKIWLQWLSHQKCWFSETTNTASHYDVEHYRPKKEAKNLDGTDRNGYWWLAFDHTNFRLSGNVPNRMKGGWFPLKAGSITSTFLDQRDDDETPYLIDPIRKTDVDLIAFDEEGKVIPIPGASDWQTERVHESAKRLKLNDHPPLPEARRKVWSEVDNLISEFKINTAKAAQGDNTSARAKAEEKAKQILKMTRPEAQLSSVARWCLQFRNDPQLTKLLT